MPCFPAFSNFSLPTLSSLPDAPTAFCFFLNILFFMVVQAVFFFFIASRQYDGLIKDKMQLLKLYLKRNRKAKDWACNVLYKYRNGNVWSRVPEGTSGRKAYVPAAAEDVVNLDIVRRELRETAGDRARVSVQLSNFFPDNVVTLDDGRTYAPLGTFHDAVEGSAANHKNNQRTIVAWCLPFVVASAACVLLSGVRSVVKRKDWTLAHTVGVGLVFACFSTEIVYFLGVFKTFRLVGDFDIIHSLFQSKIADRMSMQLNRLEDVAEVAMEASELTEVVDPSTMFDRPFQITNGLTSVESMIE